MASLDDLDGTPCNQQSSTPGILSVQYDPARGGAVTMTCAAMTTFELTVTPTGGGTVTSDRGGISCGTTCSQRYGSGTVVELTATPSSGWAFAGWSGACSGTAACTVTMDSDMAVGALFRARLTVEARAQRGTVAYSCGLTTCYRTVYSDGFVVSSPSGIGCDAAIDESGRGRECTAVFDPATAVTLTATWPPGSRFSGWSGACSGAASTCTVTMSSARFVGAYFALA